MSRTFWAGAFLGFGLGGALDAILLHQVLAWHHLLSARTDDPRTLMLADGLFHLVMWLLIVVGLWMAWHAPRDARSLWVGLLGGAGAFHVADSVLSHWVLGLHHIHPPTPWWSDSAVFALGLVLLVAAYVLHRRAS